MNRGTLLSLVNLSLVAGLVLAAADARAQQLPHAGTPGSGPETYSTPCGPGSLVVCGTKELTHCEWRLSLNIATMPYGGGFSIGSYSCRKIGEIKLFKDSQQPPPNPVCIGQPLSPLGNPRGSLQELSDYILDDQYWMGLVASIPAPEEQDAASGGLLGLDSDCGY